MAFISKEELESEATRLGVDLSSCSTWAEKQKAVFAAQAKEQGANTESGGKKKRTELNEAEKKLLAGFQDGEILISQEIPAMQYQNCKFEEELGFDMNIEEVKASTETLSQNNPLQSGTYKILGNSGRKVVAESTLPTENVKITFNSATDLVPVAEYGGKRGYLWTHPRFLGIKQLLIESGYFEKYKERFDGVNHPENIWYAGTKFPVCSIPLVHYIFAEIEEDAQQKLAKKKMI